MRIALDAMGSDEAPTVEVEGAIGALRELPAHVRVVLVGDQEVVRAELDKHDAALRERIDVVHARDRIGMGESPAQAIRRKPLSSIVVGLTLHKEGEADAFISAGSTGAVMAGSLVILKAIAGVDRPPVGAIYPTTGAPTLMLDAGANIDMRPHNLLQFALLGSTYAQDVMGVARPRVGLLNIGEEPEKGNELAVDTYPLLAGSDQLNFVGNVEGRDVVHGVCDVLVCDGFVGNVLLKFYESMAGFFAGLLRSEAGGSLARIDSDAVLRRLDYAEYGGAPLLGVNGVVVICHGGSPPKAIRNAIRMAHQLVERNTLEHSRTQLAASAASTEAA